MDSALPRFFVASGPAEPLPPPGTHSDLARAVDRLRLGAGPPRAVVADGTGALRLADAADDSLPPAVRADLRRAEERHRARRLRVDSLHLFAVDSLDPAGDVEGPDDPLALRGRLFGPFPSTAPQCVEGTLATSRGAVCASFLHAGPRAFPAGRDPHVRWYHWMLAAESERRLAQGLGVVLAYPMPAGPGRLDEGNGAFVLQLLWDVLSGVREDLRRAGRDFPPDGPLPVPDAATLARERERLSRPGGLRGLLRRLGLARPRGPSLARVEDYLSVARQALEAMPDRPLARGRALRRLVRHEEAWWRPGEAAGLAPTDADPRRPLKVGAAGAGLRVEDTFAAPDGLARLEVEHEGAATLSLLHDSTTGAWREEPAHTTVVDGLARTVFELSGLKLDRGFGQPQLHLRTRTGSVRVARVRLLARPTQPGEADADARTPTVLLPEDEAAHGSARAPAGRVEPAHVVWFDPRYPVSWVQGPALLARALRRRGFVPLDADGLRRWMAEALQLGAAGTVCVFAHDVVPDTVLTGRSARDSPLRAYLEAGGRVTWIGDAPLFHLGRADGTRHALGVGGQLKVLGLPSPVHLRGQTRITARGREWGLRIPDQATRAQPVHGLDVTLCAAGKRHASSWFKRFCLHAPGGGFLRLRCGPVDGASPDLAEEIAAVALHGLEAPARHPAAV